LSIEVVMGARPSGARLGSTEAPHQTQDDSDVVLEVVNNSGLRLHRSHVDPVEFTRSLPEVLSSTHTLILQDVGQQEVFINYTSCQPRPKPQDGSLRNPHLTEKCIAAPTILSIYVAMADGGLRALVLGGVHRVDIAATFKRLPEHADELRKLASRQGSLGFCSWEPRLAPRSAVLVLREPERGISQQRASLLDALQGAVAGAGRNEVRLGPQPEDMPEPDATQEAAKSTAEAAEEPADSKVSSSPRCRSKPPVLDSSGDTTQADGQERTSKQMAPVQKASTLEGKASLATAGLQPSTAGLNECDSGFQTPAVSAAQKDAGRSRTGALALQVQQAMKERQEKEEEERRLQREEERLKANCSVVIASQDSEYQRSLLHDQVRDLQKEQTQLQESEQSLSTAWTAMVQRRQNAEVRLSRYGENPRIRAEADRAADQERSLLSELTKVSQRLADVKEALVEKEELLCMVMLTDDPT